MLTRVARMAALAMLVAACGSAPSLAPATSSSTTPASPAVPTPVPVPTPVTVGGSTLPPAASTQVTLGIYSGRPDPVWALTRDEADKLAALVAALPVGQGMPPQGGLGYHGFTIAITAADGTVLTVTAYAKTVAPVGAAADRFWRDDAGLVERFLLETGRPTLSAAEYATIKQALDDLLR
jgi:hypothetical protein